MTAATLHRLEDRGGFPTLSPRQAEIARLIARGMTNAEIGAALGLSERTVRNHLARTFAKFGIRRRTALVTGLITGELKERVPC